MTGEAKYSPLLVLLLWLALSLAFADIRVTSVAVAVVRQGGLPTGASFFNMIGSQAAWGYVLTWNGIAFTCVLIQRAEQKISLEAGILTLAFLCAILNYAFGLGKYHANPVYTACFLFSFGAAVFLAGYTVFVDAAAKSHPAR